MARQNYSRSDLATALGVTAHTAGRKYSGEAEFTVTELVQVAHWLSIPVDQLFVSATAAAS